MCLKTKKMKLLLKNLIIFLTITIVSCNKKTTSTNTRNDSVEKYLKLASNDTLPLETRKKLNNKAFKFIDLEKNDSVVRWYLSEVTFNTLDFKDSVDYFEKSKLHYQKSIESNDTLNLARFYRYRGGFHKTVSYKLDSSFYYYLKSEKLYKRLNDENALGVIYYNKGSILSSINDFSGAELEFIKAERIFKKFKNDSRLIFLANNYGNVYSNMLQGNKALIIYKEGLKKINESKDPRTKTCQSALLTSVARVYYFRKQYSLALNYYDLAIKYPNLLEKDPGLYSFILNGIGECKMGLKKFEDLNQIFNNAIKYSKTINDYENLFYINRSISNLYHFKNDTLKAQIYADKALKFARKTNTPYNIINALVQVGKVNKDKASSAMLEYDVQVDSLLNRERSERSKFLKIQLETDEIAQEKEKAIKQKWLQTSVITGVLIIVILLFIIYKQRSQKKEFLLVQNQQKANEEIYQLMLAQQKSEEEAKQKEKRRIALELHDNVMNRLASTRFNLFTLTQNPNSETLKNAQQHIQTIKEIEDEIRSLTHELSKEADLEDNSFTAVIQQFVEQQRQMFNTNYQLEMDESIDWESIDSEIKINWYRILQEAINNCNKYAEATEIKIKIAKENHHLILNIKDNGKGFDSRQGKKGIGLANMQQRIQSINGSITINSILEKGTEIHCIVEIKD